MTAKHTPGPWHIHWPEDQGFPSDYPKRWPANFLVEFGKEGQDYGGFMVAGISGGPEDELRNYTAKEVANLIEAAPQLLEALKAMVYCHCDLSQLAPGKSCDCINEVLDAIKAAAEGTE